MPKMGIIRTTESGVDLVVEWKIENFFNLPERDCAAYWSPYFSFGGESWFLCIWPNGSSQNDSSGHVDLWLCKCASHRSIKQSYSLFLKTGRGEKYNEQYGTKDFNNDNSIHRFTRLIPRSELTIRKSELMPEYVLTVICTMKSSTSAGSDSNAESAECRHCKGTFNADSLSSHQMKCMRRPTKCPDCSEVVVLQKWLEGHECQNERPEGVHILLMYENFIVMGPQKNFIMLLSTNPGATVEKTANHEKNIPIGARSLCEDYKKVLLGGRHHDLILKVGDKELRAHRDILSARSKVFESMLDHDMKEKNTGIIDVPDCDPNAMELFLSYVYCGKIEGMDHNNMLGLYYVADKYEMMKLKRDCCNFIKKSLSLTNICSVIQLALKHSDSDLLEYATGYFSDNMLDIMQKVEWQSFLKDNSTVGNELLMKSIKKLKDAQT